MTLLAGGPELPTLVAQLAHAPGGCVVVGSSLFSGAVRSLTVVEETLGSLRSGRGCCPVRLDLVDGISRAVDRSPTPARVAVALDEQHDAVTAVFTILANPTLAQLVRLDAVIATVDAVRFATRLATDQPVETPVGLERLAIADRIVVASSRAVTPRALGAVGHVLRSVNQSGPVIAPAIAVCTHDDLLDLDAWSGAPNVGPPPETQSPFLGPDAPLTLLLQSNRPHDAVRIDEWLDDVLARHATRLLRVQGALELPDLQHRSSFCGARSVATRTYEVTDSSGQGPRSTIVLIGRDLPMAALHAEFASAHR